jgi:hypothetical protein
MSNNLPIVKASSLAATHGESFAASNLFTASDADGDTLTTFAFWDSSGNGYFVVNGVSQPANFEIDVPAGQLSLAVYQSGSGADLLWVRANDGTGWGDWQSFTVTAPIDAGAAVTGSSQSALHGQVFAASQLFTASESDGDTITQYDFWNTGTGGGRFLLNGVAQGTNQDIYISAAQLPQTTYRSSGSDTLYVRAFDGFVWGAWSSAFTVTAPPDQAPVVTPASNQTATHGQSYAAASLFTVSDADGDSIAEYDFWNTGGGGGRFVLGGVAQGTNQDIYVPAAQLTQAIYQSGAGSDTLYIRAFDGYAWSAWSPGFTVTAPPDSGPTVTAPNATLGRAASIAASSLFSATDADGDSMAQYQLWDSNPGGGRWLINGIGQLSNTAITITAGQLAQTSFQAGVNSTDDLYVRASDGYVFSPWVHFQVSAPNQLPVVTVSNQTGSPGQGIAGSSVFSASDADGDSVGTIDFFDSNPDAASGYFVFNGVVQGAGQTIAVSAGDLANVSYQFGTAADQLWVRVNDGTDWSAWQSFIATPSSGIPAGNKAPVEIVANKSATHGQSLAGSSLVSASDPDGDTIVKYQFWNSAADSSSGYFVLNGTAEPVQQSIEVTAAQLPSFSFQSGSGNDLLWVRTSDGYQWSSWQSFTVAAPVDHAPVLTAPDQTATHRQSFAASSLFTVTDADADSIVKYQLWDGSDPSAGYFIVNGVVQPSSQAIDVTAAQLAGASFQSGAGSALLYVRANDGMLWSNWVPFHVNAPADAAPVVTGGNVSLAVGQSFAVSSLFGVSDPENDPITAYELFNSSPDPANGYFIANAQVQPSGQVIDVAAAQFAQAAFVAGAQVGATDLIWERVSDGMAGAPGMRSRLPPCSPPVRPPRSSISPPPISPAHRARIRPRPRASRSSATPARTTPWR